MKSYKIIQILLISSLIYTLSQAAQTFKPTDVPSDTDIRAFTFDPTMNIDKEYVVKYEVDKTVQRNAQGKIILDENGSIIPGPNYGRYSGAKRIDMNTVPLVKVTASETNTSYPWSTDRDINVSDPADWMRYGQNVGDEMRPYANSLAGRLQEDNPVYERSITDIDLWTKEKIKHDLPDENITMEILSFNEDLYDQMKAQILISNKIKCFISRELRPAYFCPLPGKTQWWGGDVGVSDIAFSDANQSAACKEYCEIPGLECNALKAHTGLEEQRIITSGPYIGPNVPDIINIDINISQDSPSNLSQSQVLKSIDIEFELTSASEDLTSIIDQGHDENKSLIRLYFDIKTKDKEINTEETDFMIRRQMDIRDLTFKKTIFVRDSLAYIVFNFHEPIKYPGRFEQPIQDPKLKITKYTLNYETKYHWFCPITQFYIPGKNDCSGEDIVTVGNGDFGVVDQNTLPDMGDEVNNETADTNVFHICRPKEFPTRFRDADSGGYMVKNACESVCQKHVDCIPSYKHLSNSFNKNSANNFDIKIGCVQGDEDGGNSGCVPSDCKKFFQDDRMPLEEIIWDENNKAIFTVKNSAVTENAPRPRIHVDAEVTNVPDRTALFTDEMKDIAYTNMINDNTFNLSKHSINEPFEAQNAYNTNTQSSISPFFWLLKPSSKHIDDGLDYELFTILELSIKYKPLAGSFNTVSLQDDDVNQLSFSADDPNILLVDKIYLVKTGEGPDDWQIIRREEFSKGRFASLSTGTYEWYDINHERVITDKSFRFVSGEGKFDLDYGVSNKLPTFKTMQFENENPFEQIKIFGEGGIRYIVENIPGILFDDQETELSGINLKKLYGVGFNTQRGGYLHSYKVYSAYYATGNTLSYKEALDAISANTIGSTDFAIYDSEHPNLYTNKIKGDQIFSDPRVKMYIQGKANQMSMKAEFQPNYDESGKETIIFMFLQDALIENQTP